MQPEPYAVANKINDTSPFIKQLGVEIAEVRRGYVRSILQTSDGQLQSQGLVHAGVIAALIDHSSGASVATLSEEDRIVLTVEFKINFLRPAKPGTLECQAEVIKEGGKIDVVEAKAFQKSDGSSKLVAVSIVTLVRKTSAKQK